MKLASPVGSSWLITLNANKANRRQATFHDGFLYYMLGSFWKNTTVLWQFGEKWVLNIFSKSKSPYLVLQNNGRCSKLPNSSPTHVVTVWMCIQALAAYIENTHIFSTRAVLHAMQHNTEMGPVWETGNLSHHLIWCEMWRVSCSDMLSKVWASNITKYAEQRNYYTL